MAKANIHKGMIYGLSGETVGEQEEGWQFSQLGEHRDRS